MNRRGFLVRLGAALAAVIASPLLPKAAQAEGQVETAVRIENWGVDPETGVWSPVHINLADQFAMQRRDNAALVLNKQWVAQVDWSNDA